MDLIEFYSDEEIKNWLAEFFKEKNMEKEVLPNVPFGFYSLAREIGRRENLKSLLQDFNDDIL